MMLGNSRNPWTLATIAWMGMLAIVVFLTASQYGDSWDEKVRADAGEMKLSYYQHLLRGDIAGAMQFAPGKDNYPGFHDLNLALLKRVSPLSEILTGNLFSAFLGILGIIGTIRLARLVGGPMSGFWAGVLLTLLPAWYGHMFINPKDIPFACGYIWSLNFIYEWVVKTRNPSRRTVILCGIAIGITMATRIGGMLLLCYLAMFIGLGWLNAQRFDREEKLGASILQAIRIQLPRFALVACIGFFILLLYWPSGQLKPFSGASETLQNITRYDWPMPVFFEGLFVSAPDLPAHYILSMILLKVPVVILLLFISSLILFILEAAGDWDKPRVYQRSILGLFLVIFSILFPVLYVILRDSILYNGLRHLLFVLPPLCVTSGWAVRRLNDIVTVHRPWLVWPVRLAFFASLLLLAGNMIRLHPYQYIYFNGLTGGTAKASERYELDYWGTVYKELAEDFYGYLVETKPTFSKPEVVVNMEHVTYLFRPFLPENASLPIRVLRSRPDIDDYYAASTTWAADQFHEGEVVVEVKRAGALLGVVKDRRNIEKE